MDDKLLNEELVKRINELESELKRKDLIISEIKSHPDESEVKRLEKELQKSREKAISSDHFKSAFLANMSHAIRTPMNAIIGFSELIAMENISSKRKEEYTKIINEKGHQLLALIDDIIEISKLESGKLELNFKQINLDEFLHEIYSSTLQKKFKEGKDQVELILQKNQSDDFTLIETDPGRLQQILNNILAFSIRNTSKGSIEFGYSSKEGKQIEFFVQDTGIGLNKDDLRLLFDYFWQFEDITHQRLAGVGLGLTIAKQLIELLGGKVTVSSELNKGTLFQFNLSAEKQAKLKGVQHTIIHEGPQNTFSDFNWKDKVILVVEDDEINYQFIEALLEKTQAQLLHAENGVQALELCKTISQIDLILMDIKLPEVNGYQITRDIKQFRHEVPIIAQTAFPLAEVEEKCLESGCEDVITKPIEIPLFFSKVNKYLSGN